jgi:hypothetical protein
MGGQRCARTSTFSDGMDRRVPYPTTPLYTTDLEHELSTNFYWKSWGVGYDEVKGICQLHDSNFHSPPTKCMKSGNLCHDVIGAADARQEAPVNSIFIRSTIYILFSLTHILATSWYLPPSSVQ